MKINGRLEATIHVERHRRVNMHDLPLGAALLEANGRAHPNARLLTVDLGAADAVEAARESNLVAGDDRDIGHIVLNATLPGSKPLS